MWFFLKQKKTGTPKLVLITTWEFLFKKIVSHNYDLICFQYALYGLPYNYKKTVHGCTLQGIVMLSKFICNSTPNHYIIRIYPYYINISMHIIKIVWKSHRISQPCYCGHWLIWVFFCQLKNLFNVCAYKCLFHIWA